MIISGFGNPNCRKEKIPGAGFWLGEKRTALWEEYKYNLEK